MKSKRLPVLVCGALLVLAACSQPRTVPSVVKPAQAPPPPEYSESELESATLYRIDTKRSTVLITVRRDGKMKALGHDHVVASENVQGSVLLTKSLLDSHADLQIPLVSLIVDKEEYRREIGLDPEVPATAIAGTYSNMEDKVLESASFPWVDVRADFLEGDAANATLDVQISLHGKTHRYKVLVQMNVLPDRIEVQGAMLVKQSDFSLVPFSIAGGLLRVADPIALSFNLVGMADPVNPSTSPRNR